MPPLGGSISKLQTNFAQVKRSGARLRAKFHSPKATPLTLISRSATTDTNRISRPNHLVSTFFLCHSPQARLLHSIAPLEPADKLIQTRANSLVSSPGPIGTLSRALSFGSANSIANVIMAKQVTDDTKFTAARLPTSIKPTHYDLKLNPNFNDFTFQGEVSVHYQSDAGDDVPKNIVLHVNGVKITDGSLEGESNKTNPLKTVIYSPTTETATLEFQDDIAPSGTLRLKFTGVINELMKGFYKTAYKVDNTTVYAATTQFEACDARRAFPCWDEPAFKATFSLTLTFARFELINGQKTERLALSNMPEVSRSSSDTELEVKFEKTPIMSTYLLAFIVGLFEVIESEDTHRPVRVFTTPGKKEQGRFALDVACKSLPYYEDYFGIPYPLPKMDLIAIPDFTSGAMENWGLVTYRETCLLVDPKNTSTIAKQYVAIVVAHELAHQWFGNLVTMDWWTHLWLNEGFATFMEYLCTDHIFPEYDLWSQFVTDAYSQAMDLDSLNNSHPIEVPVKFASEIDEIFDSISYSKGASVIRMLYTYIGDDNFRRGMKDYLTKFAYKNAQTEDLWDCLGAASNKPVRKMMHCWTAQKGYPWLSVSSTQDGDKLKLSLTQSKFSADGKLLEEEANTFWSVPINAVVGSDPTSAREVCLLDEKTAEVVINGVGDNWCKLNPGTIGLYRTFYPDDMLGKLVSAISSQQLPAMDRLGVQDDLYAFCRAGKVDTVKYLRTLSAFTSETDFSVWCSIDDSLAEISKLVAGTDYESKFKAYGCKLYSDIYKKLDWEPKATEKHADALLRARVIGRMIAFGEPEVVKHAITLFGKHISEGLTLAPDLRASIYRAVSQYSDEGHFDCLLSMYDRSELQEEKNRLARALGFAKDKYNERVIKFILSDGVRSQDKPWVLMTLSTKCPQVGWDTFKANKDRFVEYYGHGPLMARVVKFCTENFTSREKADEIAKYFQESKFEGCAMTIQQSLETIRLHADWLDRDREAIRAFFTSS